MIEKAYSVIDEDELKEIMDSYTEPLLKYSYGILCNYADAEDAVQVTFIKLYDHQKKIDLNKSLKAYLYKIAFNTCIDISRKNKKIVLFGDTSYEESYVEEEYDIDFPAELKKALLSLKPVDRGLIVNRIVNDMSYREMSELYGKSETSLRKRYERARTKIAKLYDFDKENVFREGVCNER